MSALSSLVRTPQPVSESTQRPSNPARWDGSSWEPFIAQLERDGVEVQTDRGRRAIFVTDAGGLSYGMPHGVVTARSTLHVAAVLRAAQTFGVPVTVRGGGLTTEGESVAFGGLLLNMTGMSRVLAIDPVAMTARAEGGIFWHTFAEALRRHGLDYISAPLNFTSSIGGTLGVGGIDVNSPRHGCSADQAVALQVVTPKGTIVECSETENRDLFEQVLLGYGQFGVITEATMRIRPFTPIRMQYFYYSDLRTAIADMQWLVQEDCPDYCGILTMLDRAVNLLVAFDTDERKAAFEAKLKPRLRGHGEGSFAMRMAGHYALRPWKANEALYLAGRKRTLFPEFHRPEFMQDGKIVDRTVVFSRAVWKFWGGRHMVIPDLATNGEKFAEAVCRGNEVCRKYFPRYTLYCVGIKLTNGLPRYEMSSIPSDAKDYAWGCEFEPMLGKKIYSRDTLQSFKNEIYDIGVDMQTSYYRFGGGMKSYIPKVFPPQVMARQLAMKQKADPAMILNRDVVFE